MERLAKAKLLETVEYLIRNSSIRASHVTRLMERLFRRVFFGGRA